MSEAPGAATETGRVIETDVADVQLDDDGAPSQVNGYRVLKMLGEGTFSKVYLCEDGQGSNYVSPATVICL
ncbi:hypothetical protein PINS_up000699 [Pythium insidiosum]|nr:hypothetical protein PINS_up000699 [Pythium insidiosum]